ncbi:MAG: TonB-dependent receptor plug domain-containing protein [Gemmatimonadales bacterium]
MHTNMKYSAAFFLISFPTALLAQQRDTTNKLQPVVVTATRLPTPASSLSQPVTVLNGDELRARGVQTVAAALPDAPGATVSQSGSTGGVTSMFLRGGESRYTKVLIDGTPINSVGGTQFFQNLSLDNVDRIEIVYGPASALYGADAMSGVVQIFTRHGSGPATLDADVRAGSYGSRDGTASLRGGSARADYALGGGWHHTDGVASFNNQYTNGDLSGSLDLRPDDLSRVSLTSRYSGSVYHFPTDYTGAVNDSNSYTREHRLVLGLDAVRAITSDVRLRLRGGDNEIHGLSEDTQNSGIAATPLVKTSAPTDGYRRFVESRVEAGMGSLGTATVGAQYQVEEERSRTLTRTYAGSPAGVTPTVAPGSDDHRITRGYYIALQGSPVRVLSYDASARHDDHSDFHNVTTYHVGASVEAWQGARIRASYGTGFNAPAFYATQGSAYNSGNPKLQPEQSHSLDVGVVQSLFDGSVRAEVGAFDQRFSDLIQYVAGANSGPPDYIAVSPAYYTNLTQARSKGFSGDVSAVLPFGLTGSASYTQTIAQVYSVPPGYAGSQPGDALLRRPSHSGTASVFYSHSSDWNVGASADYVGKRPDMDFSKFPSPTVTLASYVKIGLSGSVRVMRTDASSVSLTARVDNALGKKYQDVFNFPAAGTAVLLGARISAVR